MPVRGEVPQGLLETDGGRHVGQRVPVEGDERVVVADVVAPQRLGVRVADLPVTRGHGRPVGGISPLIGR